MEYDVNDALEMLGLPPIEIHWEPVPGHPSAYGGAIPIHPNEIWINAELCLEDGISIEEVLAHELTHLWQYRHLSPLEIVMLKLAGYQNNPMEHHAEEMAPKIAQLIKRIK